MLDTSLSEKNARVEFDHLPQIYSSTSLLTVVMKNLIENGIKYNTSEQPTVRISYQETGNRHEFTFKDNGIGIDEKYHDYIFQMFKRLESREVKGSGLGLGLVSKAIEKLDGEIKLESTPGHGSSFKILLPKSYVLPS